MRRNYFIKTGQEEILFTVEAESEHAFKAIEAKLRLASKIKQFYEDLISARRAIHVVDDVIEKSRDYVDADVIEYLDS
jgi:hypothetical protein